jgi:hypothetical protein
MQGARCKNLTHEATGVVLHNVLGGYRESF